MKYQKLCLVLFLSATFLTGAAAAQQPTKIKRPVKNPPQYPNIIDLDNKDTQPINQPADQPVGQQNKAQGASAAQPDSLAGAVYSLAGELRALGQEFRAVTVRQQTQIGVLRMTRVYVQIAYYEPVLRPVRECLSALEAEEQLLQQAM